MEAAVSVAAIAAMLLLMSAIVCSGKPNVRRLLFNVATTQGRDAPMTAQEVSWKMAHVSLYFDFSAVLPHVSSFV